jgi:putative lipoprotein
VVRGTATYRERIAMPADAVFEVTLVDISRADAPASVVSRIRIASPGNPPIPFEVFYDPARIDPGRRYAVRARVLVHERPLFLTDQSYPVTLGAGARTVEVLLKLASGGPDLALEHTSWKLTNLGGQPIHIPAGAREVYLKLEDGQMSGFSGCNSLGGKYVVNADQLALTHIASTMMYCEGPGMQIEKSLHAIMGRVSRYRIDGQVLEFLDPAGTVVARFEGRTP